MTVKQIESNGYDHNELVRCRLALLCVIGNTVLHADTISSIETLNKHFSGVHFFVVGDGNLSHFFNQFHFRGSPVYIFLENGIEKARLLGMVTTERLQAFIEKNMVQQ